MKHIIGAAFLLALASPAIACTLPPQEPIRAWSGATVLYCPAASWADYGGPTVWQSWDTTLLIDTVPHTVSGVTCTADICRGSLSADAVALLRQTGVHTVQMRVTAMVKSTAGLLVPLESQPSAEVQVIMGCTYVAPGSTVTEIRAPGSALQGFNPTAGQAIRIGQLRAWGWSVEWQFVDGTPRVDKLDRLFLMAWCPL